MQHWFEIALAVASDQVDEAVGLLDWAGFGGVEVRERGDTTDVVVVVEAGDDGSTDARRASEALAILMPGEPRVAVLDPAVWTENWKQHFARRTFAGRIEVRPPWEAPPADPALVALVINPGMAFGTGLHETTAGCLELLVEEVRPGAVVADVGCGSGILAIAAARLGAASVLATDVDPLAVEATHENAVANAVAGLLRIELEPGEVGVPEWERDARPGLSASRSDETPGAATPNGATGGGFAAAAPATFDVVVANILAGTLIGMRDRLAGAVRPGGALVLSGIEAQRLKSVEEAFIRPPWRLVRRVPKGDWVSLSLRHGPEGTDAGGEGSDGDGGAPRTTGRNGEA